MLKFRSSRRHGDDHGDRSQERGHQYGHGRRHARGDFWPGGERGRGHGHGGRRGGDGRLGRLFEHGDLRFVILYLIAEKPRHGYEIIKAIEDMARGTYSPSPGTIYPALTLLEDQGYVTVEAGDGSKKLHALSEDGRAYLEANRSTVEALLARIAQVGAARGDSPAPQIVRAVENLKLALRLRLDHGPLNEDQARTIAEALDRAAGEVERS